ncbi:dehydratase [Pasteurellaceae bacterium Orientalotternb1]|nr:dehydratase [Pasteurellaceae bacterium Orientalotternb1]
MELTCPIENVESLVPHSHQMVLLDRITEFGDNFLIAESEIRPDHILIKKGRLAAFAGIEIMAQGVAAWAGCMAAKANEPVRLGYLLGTRKLHLYQQDIAIGSCLQTKITMSIQDASGFGVFDCQLIDLADNRVILEGALNVFSPKDNISS